MLGRTLLRPLPGDMRTNQIVGCGLVRGFIWHYQSRGLIPVLNGMVYFKARCHMGMGRVCRLMRNWIDNGHQPIPTSVNVSRGLICTIRGLSDLLANMVKKYNLPPYLLELEITESAYTKNLDQLLSQNRLA